MRLVDANRAFEFSMQPESIRDSRYIRILNEGMNIRMTPVPA
jgi:hypothetical protein